MDTGLAGSIHVVTGASGGIGAAICRALVAAGAQVVAHYHRGSDRAHALRDELGADQVSLVQADLTDEAQVDALWRDVLAAQPRIDGVVVNAGIWVDDAVPLHAMTLAQWRQTIDTDLTSAFLTCRGFLRHLAATPRDDASIVLIGSTAGLFGEEDHTDYAAAKAALAHGMTASLKNEIVRLAPRGRVNCVCPGWVMTPMATSTLRDATAIEAATRCVALRKVAHPDDVAHAVLFLAAPALAGHCSGAVLPLDGGMEGRLLHP